LCESITLCKAVPGKPTVTSALRSAYANENRSRTRSEAIAYRVGQKK